ncbi:amino acid ABC transporter substrate-binding protein [Parendozoicomonas haliclonae]|uniref:General L-amino acid-binding periplasmic protein AapJ n=1 Tax=Parendozoicomonas haliclonae TaxID=1960125 RepID=A0A1X7ALT7_9GAMM|nr:amino acid ABC transporter substrate-binding protein [Parendozoicomonas haliclonae]SMA46373.1 General L-amino acid-binding periplasmic protein AapJ precursor [Parendozoicomonas haliclonae]
MKSWKLLAASALGVALMAGNASASTLDTIKERGKLLCGSNGKTAGFSAPDANGKMAGFDVDFCRAISAAVFNDPDKVEYVPLTSKQRLTALQSGEIDVLSRTTTMTMSRDAGMGLSFAATTIYDGQGFMVAKKLGVTSAKELDGAAVCTRTGTNTELNMADFFNKNKMDYKPVVFEDRSEERAAFFSGRCDVMTADLTGLAGVRANAPGNPDDYAILPEVISKEPLSIAVRSDDAEWFSLVRWVTYALINAEEMGITAANVEKMKMSQDPAIQRLLGVNGNLGEKIGLSNDWAVRAIGAVGNYSEIFERNIGTNSPLKIERGINALWSDGGILYAAPVR